MLPALVAALAGDEDGSDDAPGLAGLADELDAAGRRFLTESAISDIWAEICSRSVFLEAIRESKVESEA